jgi:ABC-type multidrug transport system fused ATPase/permease subunit
MKKKVKRKIKKVTVPGDIVKHLQLARAINVLSKNDRKKLALVTCLQMCMSILDILAVSAIGLLGALTVAGLNSAAPESRVAVAIDFIGLTSSSYQRQILFIGLIAIALLTTRTILSVFFTRRTLFFLSRRGAQLSSRLISQLLSQPLLKVHEKTSQETLWAVTNGVTVIMLHILATFVTLISDVFLLFIIWSGLFFFDFKTAIVMFIVFFTVGLLLYFLMHVRAQKLGAQNTSLNVKSNEKIIEVISSYRESVVGHRRSFYAREIRNTRTELADNEAEISFQPFVSKYVIESTVITGALLIGASQVLSQDPSSATTTIAVFLAASARLAPAVLRVQQCLITLRGALGQASPTFDLIDTLQNSPGLGDSHNRLNIFHEGFNAEIQVEDVSLKYENQRENALLRVSLEIPKGALVAVVGPSGAGKSTLIDIMLGLIVPDEGKVLLSGMPPLAAFQRWPGAVAYVPQQVNIISGSIRENISCGYEESDFTDEHVLRALRLANLDKFVSNLPAGSDTQVGEKGAKLSGGERQRLGIARALFTHPQLIILDEATSALDGETESRISESIRNLHGVVTVVSIAHRLSTVKEADMVIYLNHGKIQSLGTFEQVRSQVPDFDNQLKLMSL